MATITMTPEQTAIYDSGDEQAQRDLMHELRAEAQRQADKDGLPVEIHTADGIVADAVEPALADE